MRLFIAVPVPVNVRRALYEAQRQLIKAGVTGRFVPMENYHITMKFLGECGDLAGAVGAIRLATADAKPIPLHLAGYGAFSSGGGRTGHITIDDPKKELTRLAELLSSALSDAGIITRSERFVPHITLGRGLTEVSEEIAVRREAFTADSLILYESTLTKNGPLYEALHREVF